MQPYRCYNEHEFESDDVESYFPKCPTCGASSKPQAKEPDLFVKPRDAASVPDAGGFSGVDGGGSD